MPLRPPTLTSAVTEHLQRGIIRGDYRPGEHLSADDLAESLEVSRGTVREALRMLSESGFVTLPPHRGAQVAPIDLQTIREVVGLRVVLEPYAARLAFASEPPDAELARAVENAYADLLAADESDDMAAQTDADVAFHAALAACSGDATLTAILERLRVNAQRYFLLTKLYQTDSVSDIALHIPLMEAFRAGDGEALALELERHVRRSGEALIAHLESKASEVHPGDGHR